MGQHVVAEGPDGLVVALPHRILGGWPLGHLGSQRPPLLDPLLAAAVQQPHVLVAEQGAHPQGVGGPPVGLVAVEHDRGVGGDALLCHHPGEARAVDVVAGDRVVQVGEPVELDRAGDVAGVIQQHVLIRLGHHQVGVVEVLDQPAGGDQPLGMGEGTQLLGRVVLHHRAHVSSLLITRRRS